MRLLTFTTLYPNAAQPTNGIFVENRLRHLTAGGTVESRVVAPVPWFPLRSPGFGSYASFAAAPRREIRHGLSVTHPRYPVIPKVGMTLAPLLLYRFARPELAQLRRDGYDFDAIDAHYFYPDGVAAAMLGRHFGRPVVITARGTDLNLIPRFALPRRMILWAAAQSAGLITVCQALKDTLVGMGVPADKVTVLRNGVDLQSFRPRDRGEARRRFGIDGPTLLSVGSLIPRKAHDIAVRALVELPEWSLLIAGDGPERLRLEGLVRELGLEGRVRLLGQLAHDTLPELYSAADIMSLTSSREGWANVLLEAMACGTPVVASDVWGTPEVVAAPDAGRLLEERSPAGVARAVRDLMCNMPDRAATRAYAEQFSWDATTEGQKALFSRIVAAGAAPDRARAA